MVNKYRSVKTNGFASKKEAARYGELLLLQKAGEVKHLSCQIAYIVIPKQNGERATTYLADFVYEGTDGRTVVEDVKSPPTRKKEAYIIKRKLMLWVHGIRIHEV